MAAFPSIVTILSTKAYVLDFTQALLERGHENPAEDWKVKVARAGLALLDASEDSGKEPEDFHAAFLAAMEAEGLKFEQGESSEQIALDASPTAV